MGTRNKSLRCENSIELEEIQNNTGAVQDLSDGAQLTKLVS